MFFLGSSNNGNLARAALGEHSKVVAKLTKVPESIIVKINNIWITIKCHFYINTDAFYVYCQSAKDEWLANPNTKWYPTCASIHKVNEHGSKIIGNLNVPSGLISEENSECFNKIYKGDRQYHTFQGDPKNSLLHPFKRQLLRNHPLIQEIVMKFRPPPTHKREDLPADVRALLMN